MTIKTTINYSPNFDPKKRKKKQVKYIVLHYTGMKSEKAAVDRLTKIQSQVSTHYFIRRNGKIILMVPESYIAWHAGTSNWHGKKSLNKNSIGIEISNKGHQFGYQNFSNFQIKSLIKLLNYLRKKFQIKRKNIIGHSDIAFDRKKDPGEKFPWKLLAKNKVSIWHGINNSRLIKLRKLPINKFEEIKFFNYLKKIGYLTKKINLKKKVKLIKAFQRRFRPEIINGKIDRENLVIAQKIGNFVN